MMIQPLSLKPVAEVRMPGNWDVMSPGEYRNMAKIFMVYGTSQHGDVVEWPWLECAEVFELDELCRAEDRPKFGNEDTSPWPSDIVVHLDVDEAAMHGIAPGFFVCALTIDEAESRLNQTRQSERLQT